MRYVDVAKNIIDEFVFTTQKVDYKDEYNLIAGECSWFYDLFCHNTYQINNHTFHNKTFVDFILPSTISNMQSDLFAKNLL